MNIIDDEGPRSTIDGIVCISDTKDLVPSCSCQSRLDIRSADKVLRLHCSLQRSTNLLDVAENLPNAASATGNRNDASGLQQRNGRPNQEGRGCVNKREVLGGMERGQR